VVKPLGKELKGLSCYAGSTILGDGSVALILDVLGLAERACVLSTDRGEVKSEADARGPAEDLSQLLLLFRSGNFTRLAVPLSLVARLEEFPQSRIERAGGQQDSLGLQLPQILAVFLGGLHHLLQRQPVANQNQSVHLLSSLF